MPWKDWQDGDTISAADLHLYLANQAVLAYASEAARDAEVPTPGPGWYCWTSDTGNTGYGVNGGWKPLAEQPQFKNLLPKPVVRSPLMRVGTVADRNKATGAAYADRTWADTDGSKGWWYSPDGKGWTAVPTDLHWAASVVLRFTTGAERDAFYAANFTSNPLLAGAMCFVALMPKSGSDDEGETAAVPTTLWFFNGTEWHYLEGKKP